MTKAIKSKPGLRKQNPRLVPIGDSEVLDLAVDVIQRKLETWARATVHETGTPGHIFQVGVELPRVKGGTRAVTVRVVGEPFVFESKKFLGSGGYGDNYIEIGVMPDRIRREFGHDKVNEMSRYYLRKEVREFLSHEMTHGAEYKLGEYAKKEGEDGFFAAYLNDPMEIRAKAREIWEEIKPNLDFNIEIYELDRNAGKVKVSLPEYLLQQTDEYRRIDGKRDRNKQRVLTDASRKHLLRIIERELREAGVDVSGAGALPNPTTGTLTIPLADGSEVKVPMLDRFGDVAAHEMPKGKKKGHTQYSVTYVPTGQAIRKSIRTQPEAVAIARFYGSVPEGIALLKGVFAGNKSAVEDVVSGRSLQAWQEQRKAKHSGPKTYTAHYWVRLHASGVYPDVESAKEQVRLDDFVDALALSLGLEAKYLDHPGFVDVKIVKRIGTEETELIVHRKDKGSREWYLSGATDSEETRSVPRDALSPYREDLPEIADAGPSLPEGFDGFGENPAVSPFSSVIDPRGVKWSCFLNEGPAGWEAGEDDPTRNDEGQLDPKLIVTLPGCRGEHGKFERVPTGRKSKQQFAALARSLKKKWRPDEPILISKQKNGRVCIWEGNHRVRAAIKAGMDLVPVWITYLGNSQRIGLVYDPKTGKWNGDTGAASSNPKASRGVPEDLLRSPAGREVDVHSYKSAKDAEQEYYGDLDDFRWVMTRVPIKHLGCDLITPGSRMERELEQARFERLYDWMGDDPVSALESNPIIVLQDGTILDGCHRYHAWKRLKLTKTPIPAVVGIPRETRPNPSESGGVLPAATFAWRPYVSRLIADKDAVSEFVREAKEGRVDQRMVAPVADGLTLLVERHPEFDGVDAVVPVPRRKPGTANDLEAVGKALAERLGVPYLDGYLVRKREPQGGREVIRRMRFPSEEHARTMAVAGRARPSKPLVLDNVLATGATLSAAYEVIRKQGKAEPVGLAILWSPDFWQAPESDRMGRRKNP